MEVEELSKRMAQRARIALAHRGWTVPQLAERIGDSRQYVHRMMKSGKWNGSTLVKFANALGFQVDFFVVDDSGYIGECLCGADTNLRIKDYWQGDYLDKSEYMQILGKRLERAGTQYKPA